MVVNLHQLIPPDCSEAYRGKLGWMKRPNYYSVRSMVSALPGCNKVDIVPVEQKINIKKHMDFDYIQIS